ncbi:helix-turn-helix domain-containing protein [Oryzibacter oryziterrae]|uniref:helix-turn-helix domain-containing protein n=1 Tax=Oryzibacter oryziterrae TaxID=2766474 RepID=UPI001F01CC0E|nr:helix-turn-helix domain-containing protein [Oryzibacter oryziterrae]
MLENSSPASSAGSAAGHAYSHVLTLPVRAPRSSPHSDGIAIRLPGRSRLFDQSEEVGSTFEIVQGAVMLSRLLRDGRRQIVDILGPGRLFGAVMSPVQEVAAETLTASEIRVHGPDAEFSEARINNELRLAIDRLQTHAVLLGRKTALERVASGMVGLAVLLAGSRALNGNGPISFRLPLTRSDLADWLGLVLETVSRNLSQLQKAGLISIEKQDRVQILDMAGLKQVAAYETKWI